MECRPKSATGGGKTRAPNTAATDGANATSSTQRPPLIVIVGATATGKTAQALTLARQIGGALIGADSVQIYRELDIGSAKPTAAELGGIEHHLISALPPDAAIDAAAYARMADAAIRAAWARGKPPVVVGGTGLWLRALLRGLVQLPPVDPDLRAHLLAEAEHVGAAKLHARLQRVDPVAAGRIHPHDTQRLVRALEVYQQCGQPLGRLQDAHRLGVPRYRAWVWRLERPAEQLRARIAARLQTMVAAGWVAEVQALVARYGPDLRALRSVGYRQLVAHVEGQCDLATALARAQKATWIYAKQQRRWFRHEPAADWPRAGGPSPVQVSPAGAAPSATLRTAVDAFLADAAPICDA
ncbi:MAG: tRNA (adenosine(37)-N6)-dimethylallyltransferase MiaA [Polyangiales bacterium]